MQFRASLPHESWIDTLSLCRHSEHNPHILYTFPCSAKLHFHELVFQLPHPLSELPAIFAFLWVSQSSPEQLNIPNITNNNFVFSYCTELTEIEGISGVFLSGGNNVFGNTGKLTTLGEIYGDITGTVKVNSSPLDLPTAKRIIEALKNYAGTSKEGVYSVTFSTTTLGYLEAEGATAPNDMTWIDYANAKGWNI